MDPLLETPLIECSTCSDTACLDCVFQFDHYVCSETCPDCQ